MAALLLAGAARATAFEFRDGDCVAMLGATLMERDQHYGAFESAMTLAAGTNRVTFRNLAWSADTVFGDSRSYFGTPADGLARLTNNFALVKPTVVMSCYGADVAFDENFAAALQKFIAGYRSWLDLVKTAANNPRIVIIAPPPLENLPPPRPNHDAENANLAKLREALKSLAAERQATFVDLFERMKSLKPRTPLTDNGVHFTKAGYDVLSQAMLFELGFALQKSSDAKLRGLIVRKDELFFNRYRPHNETYLFLFRKHEQGKNAAEIPQFDPLIAEGDALIHKAKLELLKTEKASR